MANPNKRTHFAMLCLRLARRRQLQTARELRKQENIKLRQRLLPLVEDRTVA